MEKQAQAAAGINEIAVITREPAVYRGSKEYRFNSVVLVQCF
jgi:hypothetical protein